VGSQYKSLIASTNDAYCPTLRGITEQSCIIDGVNCVLEIVIDGLDIRAVENAMRTGMQAAAKPGIKQITAGNYGGNLGQFKIHLKNLIV